MAGLSDWLQLMLAEMARKREEEERARAEQQTRERESGGPGTAKKDRSGGNLTPD